MQKLKHESSQRLTVCSRRLEQKHRHVYDYELGYMYCAVESVSAVAQWLLTHYCLLLQTKPLGDLI